MWRLEQTAFTRSQHRPIYIPLPSLFPESPKAENFLKTKGRDCHFPPPKAENILKTKLLVHSGKKWVFHHILAVPSSPEPSPLSCEPPVFPFSECAVLPGYRIGPHLELDGRVQDYSQSGDGEVAEASKPDFKSGFSASDVPLGSMFSGQVDAEDVMPKRRGDGFFVFGATGVYAVRTRAATPARLRAGEILFRGEIVTRPWFV